MNANQKNRKFPETKPLSNRNEYDPRWCQGGIGDLKELCELLSLPETVAKSGETAAKGYPLWIPRSLLSRILPGDPKDPVLLQFLPREEEEQFRPGFEADPLKEQENGAHHPLLQKYHGRALLLTTEHCAASCRYCFRRGFPKGTALFTGQTSDSFEKRAARTFEKLREIPTLEELILSGGDPLVLSNDSLKNLFHYIRSLPTVNRVRIHTRLAVLLPERIDASFCELIREWDSFFGQESGFSISFVFQINHPNELNSDVFSMFRRLHSVGALLMSQTVLLRGINDDAEILVRLYGELSRAKVVPYYLHQLDRVQGAAEFEVAPEKGWAIMEELRKRLPGYAVPRYVRERPGCPYKGEVERCDFS